MRRILIMNVLFIILFEIMTPSHGFVFKSVTMCYSSASHHIIGLFLYYLSSLQQQHVFFCFFLAELLNNIASLSSLIIAEVTRCK